MTQRHATPKKGHPWPPWAAAFLDRLAQFPNMTRAAEAVGVNRSTVYRLRDRDEVFASALDDAREKALDLLEESIFVQATSGLPNRKIVRKMDASGNLLEITETEEILRNPTLAMFFLKRWRPEYRESYRIDRTLPNGLPPGGENSVVNDAVRDFYAELDRPDTPDTQRVRARGSFSMTRGSWTDRGISMPPSAVAESGS